MFMGVYAAAGCGNENAQQALMQREQNRHVQCHGVRYDRRLVCRERLAAGLHSISKDRARQSKTPRRPPLRAPPPPPPLLACSADALEQLPARCDCAYSSMIDVVRRISTEGISEDLGASLVTSLALRHSRAHLCVCVCVCFGGLR